MKSYLRKYLTPNEQKALMLLLAIAFIAILAISEPFNNLYSDEVSPDSIKKDIEEPYQLCVDVTKASREEIILIKGIGEHTADKIIAFRDTIVITSNYDLLAIKGIGEKSLAKWLPFLKSLPNDSLHNKNINISDKKTASNKNKKDINQASLSDIIKVKGVGEVRAKQIIKFRNQHNGLNNMQELLSIKGIGKKTLAKIEELFYVGLE